MRTIHINGTIGSAKKYKKQLDVLLNNSPTTDIRLHLNTPGGDYNTALVLYNAIKTHGNVTTHLSGECYSAGSIIALASDQIVVSPLTTMMIHNPKLSESYNEVCLFTLKQEMIDEFNIWKNDASKIYEGFLTEEEFNDMLYHGKTHYFNSDEIKLKLYGDYGDYRRED